MSPTTFRRALWVLALATVGALVWIVGFGGAGTASFAFGGSLIAMLPERDRVRAALRSAAERYGLPPEWLDVIGWHESRWRLAATNQAGADGARGGAWGPTQITERTARAYGYTGDMFELTRDPDLAAEWTARIISAGPVDSLENVAAYWNAGRRASDPNLPASARAYVAQVVNEVGNLPAPPDGVA